MSIQAFLADFPRSEDPGFSRSPLWPVAPEYATGEVLLGAAYRKLLLDVRDADINLERIENLAEELELSPREVWQELFIRNDGLSSPPPRGRRQGGRLRQLMPLVPEVSRHALVLGRMRNRWEPGNLLLRTLACGAGAGRWSVVVSAVKRSLSVDENDDILARYVESKLYAAADAPRPDPDAPVDMPPAPWRMRGDRLTPSERFTSDLLALVDIKAALTRRQWTVLVESCVRVGLGLHVLWLLGLNSEIWRLTSSAAEGEETPSLEDVAGVWEHHYASPILTIGSDASASIRRYVQRFVLARMGLNLTLHALRDAGVPWESVLASSSDTASPQESVASFLRHVAENRKAIESALRAAGLGRLPDAVAEACDGRGQLLESRSGFSKNISEFLRYALGQMQPDDPELAAYDQGYLLKRRTAAANSTLLCDPGPASLLFLVFACSVATATPAPSIDVFRDYLRSYGIHAPAGELVDGNTIRSMEQLGLVIDSPDAGGGRLFVRPF